MTTILISVVDNSSFFKTSSYRQRNPKYKLKSRPIGTRAASRRTSLEPRWTRPKKIRVDGVIHRQKRLGLKMFQHLNFHEILSCVGTSLIKSPKKKIIKRLEQVSWTLLRQIKFELGLLNFSGENLYSDNVLEAVNSLTSRSRCYCFIPQRGLTGRKRISRVIQSLIPTLLQETRSSHLLYRIAKTSRCD